SYSASSSGCIAHGAAVAITERLAELPDLALPSSLYKEAARPPATGDILAYLQALLQKDPAAFLARYGGVLQCQELNHFEALRSADFEVDHWLGVYAAQRIEAADQAANPGRLPARVKNRRLAAMRRLAAQGEYFSDDSMRHREPLLYHQQIGRFVEEEEERQQQQQEEEQQQRQEHNGQAVGASCSSGLDGALRGSCLASSLRQVLEARDADSSAAATLANASPSEHAVFTSGSAEGMTGRGGDSEMQDAPGTYAWNREGASVGPSAAGASRPYGDVRANMLFSEFLMRQDEEAQLVMRRIRQQQEEDAQMSEHDSDQDDDDDAAGGAVPRAGGPYCGSRTLPSASERAQMRRDFLSEMQSRFLLGQDGEYVDYGAIDADTSLDGDWLEEEARDAEEKYFDED
ncbi:hypothetical protein VaNZ11_013363, partial [Volvox africanus]